VLPHTQDTWVFGATIQQVGQRAAAWESPACGRMPESRRESTPSARECYVAELSVNETDDLDHQDDDRQNTPLDPAIAHWRGRRTGARPHSRNLALGSRSPDPTVVWCRYSSRPSGAPLDGFPMTTHRRRVPDGGSFDGKRTTSCGRCLPQRRRALVPLTPAARGRRAHGRRCSVRRIGALAPQSSRSSPRTPRSLRARA
jgi:hypothetical protein